MATPLSDALAKLILHIKPITDQIGVREVNDYPKAMVEHINPPVIDIQTMPEGALKNVGQGSSLIIQHPFNFRLWFYSEELSASTKFQDAREKLEAIQDYLLHHLSVDNGWGDLGLSDADTFEGLNINPGEIFGMGGAVYEGGYIDVSLKRLESY